MKPMAGNLGPKQFSLAALLVATTVVALVCGMVKSVGAPVSVVAALTLICGVSWLLVLTVIFVWLWRE